MSNPNANQNFRTYIVDGISVPELYDVAGVYGDQTSINAGRLSINFRGSDAAEEFEMRCRTHRLEVVRKIERLH